MLEMQALSLKSLVFLLGWTALVSGCSTSPLENEIKQKQESRRFFIQKIEKNPTQIWASSLPRKARQALNAYEDHQLVGPHHLEYGYSVRNFVLSGKSVLELDREIADLGCTKQDDVLKNPQNQHPLKDSKGKTIPLWVYLCPDGGVFRIKPKGDPTSRYRKGPQASKALRFPYDSLFESFDDEMIKVDNDGNAVPKWVKDLNLKLVNQSDEKRLIEGWANDAHTDL